MFRFISMKEIKRDFDCAMHKAGYVRADKKCKEWGITAEQLSALIQKGYKYDNFIVNGVRYIHVDSKKPDIPAKTPEMYAIKIWPIDYM